MRLLAGSPVLAVSTARGWQGSCLSLPGPAQEFRLPARKDAVSFVSQPEKREKFILN